jgi:hypothetical protein
VRDEEDPHAQALAQAQDQAQDLQLQSHVQGRRGLVRDEQRGIAGNGHGDHRPLLHAPRQLVGVAGKHPPPAAQPHEACQLLRLCPCLRPAHAKVQAEHLGDLRADLESRVQVAGRLLEDHGDLPAPHPAALLGGQPEQVAALEQDLTRIDAGRRGREQPHDAGGGDGLARPGFPHEAADLPRRHPEVDPPQRPGGRSASAVEADLETPHIEKRTVLPCPHQPILIFGLSALYRMSTRKLMRENTSAMKTIPPWMRGKSLW